MIAKTITYVDYNGNERTETFRFNFTPAEITEMELSQSGGLSEMIKKLIETQDHPAIIKIFKELILKAYGEKSPDGKRFIKSEELSKAFSETEAYTDLYMSLATDAGEAAKFFEALIPKKAVKKSE